MFSVIPKIDDKIGFTASPGFACSPAPAQDDHCPTLRGKQRENVLIKAMAGALKLKVSANIIRRVRGTVFDINQLAQMKRRGKKIAFQTCSESDLLMDTRKTTFGQTSAASTLFVWLILSIGKK